MLVPLILTVATLTSNMGRGETARGYEPTPHPEPHERRRRAPRLDVRYAGTHRVGRLLKTMVSNYTITDGSVSVVLRSPFDVPARGESWSGCREMKRRKSPSRK